MVEPPSRPQRSIDSISLRQLNEHVAASQPHTLVSPPASASPAQPLRHRRRRRYLLPAIIAILLVGGGGVAAYAHAQLQNKFSLASVTISAVKVATQKTIPLQGQTQGRTNFLIFGMTKDGLRTDSIMLASYYYQQKKLVTLNIPRDLYVDDGYEHAKFGEVYAYAKLRQPSNPQYPDQFVSNLVSREYGIPINYWVQLNMQGEVELINSIGGVDVDVPDAFTDYEYPTWDYSGYVRPAPHFNAGLQHMDGNTALVFSRSRHSLDNGEGSDFARSKRQGLVLQAAITKVKAEGLLSNVAKLNTYLGIVQKNVSTNLSTDEMLSAAKLMKNLNPSTDHIIANWSTASGFLCNSTSSAGASIILYGIPGNCTTAAGGQQDSPYREQAIAYVQNLLESASPPPAATTGNPTTSSSPATSPTP